MAITAEYLGMTLRLSDLEVENLEYFGHCAAHEFHLQQCEACHLLRYPPTTACPWCASPEARWTPVEGKGAVHSYTEVHHAIQPQFKPFTPYMVLLVDLDTQKGRPTEQVRGVGIGTRVRISFTDVAPGLSLPQWTIDDGAAQPQAPWRYPHE